MLSTKKQQCFKYTTKKINYNKKIIWNMPYLILTAQLSPGNPSKDTTPTITFVQETSGNRVVLVLDTSGSMQTQTRGVSEV